MPEDSPAAVAESVSGRLAGGPVVPRVLPADSKCRPLRAPTRPGGAVHGVQRVASGVRGDGPGPAAAAAGDGPRSAAAAARHGPGAVPAAGHRPGPAAARHGRRPGTAAVPAAVHVSLAEAPLVRVDQVGQPGPPGVRPRGRRMAIAPPVGLGCGHDDDQRRLRHGRRGWGHSDTRDNDQQLHTRALHIPGG